MKKFFSFESLAVGLAMFSMFFGAGNVIFPLALGQYAGNQTAFAIVGLIITAIVMPFTGVFAMVLFRGNTQQFFGRLGRWPGFLVALTVISLLGPLGSTPRCIALTYTTLKNSMPLVSPLVFNALACLVIYLFTMNKKRILSLLGIVLTPLLLLSLLTVVVIGLFSPGELIPQTQTNWHMFVHGLQEGYNTMDLLAALFFSSAILSLLKKQGKEERTDRECIRLTLQASCVGAFLLSLVYIGFCYLAAIHAGDLGTASKDELLSMIIIKLAGPSSGLLVSITIALACLTTAIALISAFTDFFQKEVCSNKITYKMALILSLAMTYGISTLEFNGISAFLGPILQVIYPVLILLTFFNIAYKLSKTPQPM